MFDQINVKYNDYIKDIEEEWAKVSDMPRGVEDYEVRAYQKDFAMAVKDVKCKGILFRLRGGKYDTFRDAILDVNVRRHGLTKNSNVSKMSNLT